MREAMPDLRQIKERREEEMREAEAERLAMSLKGKTTRDRVYNLTSAFFGELKLDARRIGGVFDASSGSKKK